jgi:type IV pilus assembly protein PilB
MNGEPSPAAPAPSPPGDVVALLLKEQLITEAQVRHGRRVQEKLESPRGLLTVLLDLQIVTSDQIRQAVRANPQSMRLGDLLIDLGHLRESDLRGALAAQQASGGRKRLGDILVESRVISEHKLTEVLADLFGLALVEPRVTEIDRGLLVRMNLRRAQECGFIPVSQAAGRVTVAFADPLDATHKMAAEQMFGANIVPAIARRSLILEGLAAFERGLRSASGPSEHTAMQLVVDLIREALESGTSDIHIEPLQAGLRVRFRLDGVMIEHRSIDRELGAAVVSRIKVLAGADIAERRRHQDGRIKFEDPQSGATADIRASFYVTIHGEKVVLRLLNRKTELISIKDIGMGPRMLDRFIADALDVPTGVVIITGPTGSGKTTTLYAALAEIRSIEDKIITIEDPVEYQLRGITQIPINEKKGLTFARGLRSILRHDPDKIMVGEIRDPETAQIAIQSALTGHLVFTTVHANNVFDVLGRFLNMGVEPYQFISALNCVMAQRLVRRICESCKREVQYEPELLIESALNPALAQAHRFYEGAGCMECGGTGFKGRMAICELLDLTDHIREIILDKRPISEVKRAAKEQGMRFLRESAVERVMHGLTTLREINKVTFVE